MIVASICADTVRVRRLGGEDHPELMSIAVHAPVNADRLYDGISLHLPSAGLENAQHARQLAAELLAEADFIERAVEASRLAATQALIAAAATVEVID